MQRRYVRFLPIVLAILVASAVTAVFAFLVLPADDDPRVEAPSELDGELGQLSASPVNDDVDNTPATATRAATVKPTARSATEPPRSTQTSTPESTATTAISPTPVASPTRRPPSAANNLVSNGGFQGDFDGWYTEGQVTIAATAGRNDGPAIQLGPSAGYADRRLTLEVGKTYRLQAWGHVSVLSQIGVVGFQYWDVNGNRLESAEPPPLTFDQTTTVRKSLQFTFPDNVARVHVYLWNQGGLSVIIIDDVSVREIISQDESLTPAIG